MSGKLNFLRIALDAVVDARCDDDGRTTKKRQAQNQQSAGITLTQGRKGLLSPYQC